MQKPDWILFDCMETIVDVFDKPDRRMYASWGYTGSGLEGLWTSLDSFVEDDIQIREGLIASHEKFREFNTLDIFRAIAGRRFSDGYEAEMAAKRLLQTFWKNYAKNCYVDATVKNTLKELSSQYHCAVVSNFMVDGGIEDLLEVFGMTEYFDFVVTSVRTGWKKPNPKIYDAALANVKAPKEKILFVGDTYDCDYSGPIEYGFQAVLLDKENRYSQVTQRIQAIRELPDWLKKLPG